MKLDSFARARIKCIDFTFNTRMNEWMIDWLVMNDLVIEFRQTGIRFMNVLITHAQQHGYELD